VRRIIGTLALAALIAGCSSSSTGPDDVEDIYRTRTSPANVIYNLNLAYEEMDCEAFLDCLADSFRFYVSEYDSWGDPDLPDSWGMATERTIHRRMFGDEPVGDPSLEIQQITLTLITITQEHSGGANPVDSSDDRWTHLLDTDLMVWFPNNLQRRADEDVEMVFRIDPDETGRNGETLYELIGWYDLAGEEERGESTSWGGIKAMYR
jgi:hypothetical protein